MTNKIWWHMEKAKEIGEESGINWLVSVLKDNVGWHEWVLKTPEELEEYRKTLPNSMRANAYPLKVITHSIPAGSNIELEQGKYLIQCNNEEIREMLVGMAQRYEKYSRAWWQLQVDPKVDDWKPASESPDSIISPFQHRTVLVKSDILSYVGGVWTGYHDLGTGKWYVYAKGKALEHPVTYWRRVPSFDIERRSYEEIKGEVEVFKKEAEIEPHDIINSAYFLLCELASGKSADHLDVRQAMEDLREGMNSRDPTLFPHSLLNERVDAPEDMMEQIDNLLANVHIPFNELDHPNEREMLVSRDIIEKIRVVYQEVRPDGGYSMPYPSVKDGFIVKAEDDGMYQKPRGTDMDIEK